ncbi:bifunctional diguanylate cyclase/phosphodiesterase [Yoonia sp. SS1-5]|uniref:Bifunctional diguanylate cyclase/phosphodiesterase n=1 Tax=Yoonia rhodophyticola TaxID=3137370 RepID=A0AAN0MC28_9RHOB
MMKWTGNRINPARLWFHYSAALCLIFGLLLVINQVSNRIVAKGAEITQVVEASAKQAVLSQSVLLKAAQLTDGAGADTRQLLDLTHEFETAHLDLMQGGVWSDALYQHYYSGRAPLNGQMRQFADLANQLALFPPDQRPGLLRRMHLLHDETGLFAALKQATDLFELAGRQETRQLKKVLRSVLALSAGGLVIITLFIFLPAQLTAKHAIRRLESRTAKLTRSQGELEATNAKLEHLVNYDALTGLPNRSLVAAHLCEGIKSDALVDMSLLLLGLDGFKAINDAVGHEAGDLILVGVAECLKTCVDDDQIVGRAGGDKFVILTNEAPEIVAKRALACISADPYVAGGRCINVGAAVGHVTITPDIQHHEQILTHAEIALQTAKQHDWQRVVGFSQELHDEVAAMRQLQLELSDAIQDGQIEPWFQPQISLADGRLRGAEVLARWRHPTRGLLTPDKFLPAAERAGLIVDMDHAVWKAALEYAHQWQQDSGWRPCISLNAAPATIADPHLIERLLMHLHKTDLQVDQVVIEVLETTLIEGSDDMAAINIDGLAECGVSLELDDFGTGYASLSKLTQLPLTGIKLDRSLIAPLPDPGADSVVRAILALAVELGLLVVAEGIEEDAQATHLGKCGCAVGQGYGFARPMAASDFDQWLRDYTGAPIGDRVEGGPWPLRA